MKNKNKTFSYLLQALLLVVSSASVAQKTTADRTSPPRTAGHADSAVSKGNEIVVSWQEEALNSLRSLLDGQRLHLEVREVQLNATVTIAASNVAVYGSEQRTRIHCPDDGGAFLIRGQNVTLVALELSNCPNSALKIKGYRTTGAKSRSAKLHTSQSRKKSRRVNKSRVEVVDCLFANNTAPSGAAIDIDHSELHVRSSVFVGNAADYDGGALHAFKAKIWIENSSFVGNEANKGGAMYAEKTQSLNVTDSTFRTNSAARTRVCEGFPYWICESGGAIYARECQNVRVTSSAFHDNTADKRGGAVYTYYCSSVTVEGSAFHDNTATDGGGAVEASYCTDVTVEGSKFHNNAAKDDGGAVNAYYCTNLIVKGSNFHNNTANSDGGAIEAYRCLDVKVEGSAFHNNTANDDAGAVDAFNCTDVRVEESTFHYNTANYDGGAIQAYDFTSVTVEGSTFHYNTANQGGAIHAGLRLDVAVRNSSFNGNAAGFNGGAVDVIDGIQLRLCDVMLRNNSAVLGGGVSLRTSSKLIADEYCRNVTFLANTAFRGGGLFCSGCTGPFFGKDDMSFQGNVAAESGGGSFMVDASTTTSTFLNRTEFVGNVASYGGGLAMRDCHHMKVDQTTFTENFAIDGGGFHITSVYGEKDYYYVEDVILKGNQAHSLSRMRQTNKTTVSDWLKARERFLFELERDWLHPDEYSQGRGGGVFISLQNQREDSTFDLLFLDVSITNNTANAGGGMYIDSEYRVVSSDWCPYTRLILEPCISIAFRTVKFIENTAYSGGGGLFVRSPHSLVTYGISGRSLLPEKKCSTLSTHAYYTLCYQDNHISCDDDACYGAQFASSVLYLELQNVSGPLKDMRSGDRLAVHKNSNEGRPSGAENVTIAVKDALGRIIRGKTADSELAVILQSKWTRGQLRYNAVNGIITITSTQVFGYNITGNLTIQSDDERKISATLEFSTLPCPNGELPTESQTECFRCSAQTYSFEAGATKCHPCQKNARCGGTAMLVPDEGYWHSTPFSPVIRRCPLEEACSFEGRAENLTQYYNENDIQMKLKCINESTSEERNNCFGNYTQCDNGYEGVLCGQCADGFGHASDGSCKLCSRTLLVTVILTVLGVGVFFLVLTGKVGLAVDGVRKQVSSDLKEERRAIARTLAQHRSSSLPSTLDHETRNRSDEHVNPPSERRASEQAEVMEQLVDEGTSATPDGTHRTLQRTERQIEEPLLGSSSEEQKLPSTALSAASGLLVATYNILFNYIQLSTTVLTLDVEWGSALNYFFALNGALGRVMHIEFLPLDCAFSDRDHDIGTPNSLVVLWLRICFPLMSMVFYLFIVVAVRLFRGEMRMSKYEVDFLPTLRLICVVVYLAYCIDLVADLLKVFSCIDLSNDYDEGHMYKEFEDLALDTVWLEDTSVICWKGSHLISAIIAAMGLAVCLCVILSMVVTLHRGSERGRLRNPEFVKRYGILYLDYRTDGIALHWESILTVRRMLLGAIQVHASHKATSGVEIGLYGLLIFTFLALQDIFQPFADDGAGEAFPDYAGSEVSLLVSKRLRNRWIRFNRSITLNDLEGSSLFMTLSVFLVAGCICGEELNNVESALLLSACFVLNGVFSLFMIYRLWYGVHQYLDAMAEEKELEFTVSGDGQGNRNMLLPFKMYKVLTYNDNKEEEEVHSGDDNV